MKYIIAKILRFLKIFLLFTIKKRQKSTYSATFKMFKSKKQRINKPTFEQVYNYSL